MSDIQSYFGLINTFSIRFRQYLLFLEVTNDLEMVCRICSYLTVEDILHLTSTSKHFFTLQSIQSLQVRLLRAKVEFYQQPNDHTYQPFLHFIPIKMQTEIKSVKRQKLIKEHQALKKFNQDIRLYKYLRKEGVNDNKQSSQRILERKKPQQIAKIQDYPKTKQVNTQELSLKSSQHKSYSDPKEVKGNNFTNYQAQKRHQEKNHSLSNQKVDEYNPYIKRLHEVEYQLAKEDYQKRKRKRMIENNQKKLISLEQLKQMAQTDPCSREVYIRVYQEEKAKIQRENVSQLRMMSFKGKSQQITLQGNPPQKVQKVVVVRQSIAGKLLSGLKSIIWRQ